MISIPIAVANDVFKKQISFFQFQHLNVYKEKAKDLALIPIVKYNHYNEIPIDNINWDLKLPYMMVDSIYDYIKENKKTYIPINVFIAVKQVLNYFDDNQVIEIIDSDLVHLKPYPKWYDHIGYDMIIADDAYNGWHMHIAGQYKQNRAIIDSYLNHNEDIYINGGFNAIGRVKTIKKIIDDIIDYSILIAKNNDARHGWWCAMYGLNIACHNNKIEMISNNNCYYPGFNQLENNHYIAHYNVDEIFNKHLIPNLDVNTFPDNAFYNKAKEWLAKEFST